MSVSSLLEALPDEARRAAAELRKELLYSYTTDQAFAMLLFYRQRVCELKAQFTESLNEGIGADNFWDQSLVYLLDRESIIEKGVAFFIEALYWREMTKMQVRLRQEFS